MEVGVHDVLPYRPCPLLRRFKTEIDKLADENTWVRMRATDGGAGADSGPALRWTLAASFGLDLVSPAVLLTIHTGSTESVMKLRMRYLNRHLDRAARSRSLTPSRL